MVSCGWRSGSRDANGAGCARGYHPDYGVVARANRVEFDTAPSWLRYCVMDSCDTRGVTEKAFRDLGVGIHGGPAFAPVGLELSETRLSGGGAGAGESDRLSGD